MGTLKSMGHNGIANNTGNIALFVSCSVDLFRPEAGFAAATLLQQAGCRVSVPAQSCCGQIAYNNGLASEARALAWQIVESFADFDYVVVPSGSCTGMIRHHYPKLFEDDPRHETVKQFAARVYELTSFLVDILDWQPAQLNLDLKQKRISYHDSCAGLRELGIQTQARELLKHCNNVVVNEIDDSQVCCGFGGSFCMKFPDIANRMAEEKLACVASASPDYLVGGDVSCLLHLSGKWQRMQADSKDSDLQIRHVAELLAGDLDSPPINSSATNAKDKSNDTDFRKHKNFNNDCKKLGDKI